MTMPTRDDAVAMIRELDLEWSDIYAARGVREVFVPGCTVEETQPRVDAWCAARGITEGVAITPDKIDLPGGGATDACRIKISIRSDA